MTELLTPPLGPCREKFTSEPWSFWFCFHLTCRTNFLPFDLGQIVELFWITVLKMPHERFPKMMEVRFCPIFYYSFFRNNLSDSILTNLLHNPSTTMVSWLQQQKRIIWFLPVFKALKAVVTFHDFPLILSFSDDVIFCFTGVFFS